MKVAEVLSDLVSLQACDRNAAMNLVSPITQAQDTKHDSTENATVSENLSSEPALSRSLSGLANEEAKASLDLQRALDLVDLHYGVKERYIQEEGNATLEKARREVEIVAKAFR